MAQDRVSLGFIGLGGMGTPMVRNLLAAGFAVRVFNRNPAKASALLEAGARVCATPRDVAEPGGIVITMVADDAALNQVTSGPDGFGEVLGANGVHVSMSTVGAATTRALADYHDTRGSTLVAAPVFGRPDAAAAKLLWIVAAGAEAAKARVRPLFDAMGQKVFDFGTDPAAASVVKLSGNFLIVAAMEAMAEALALVERHGIDRTAVASMWGETLFACRVYQSYGRAIAEHRYEPAAFRLALGLKDVSLVLDAAKESRTPMPLASLGRDRFLSALAHGRDDIDWSALGIGATEDAGLAADGPAGR